MRGCCIFKEVCRACGDVASCRYGGVQSIQGCCIAVLGPFCNEACRAYKDVALPFCDEACRLCGRFAMRRAEHTRMLRRRFAIRHAAMRRAEHTRMLRRRFAISHAEHSRMLHCADRLGVLPLLVISCNFEKGVWAYA